MLDDRGVAVCIIFCIISCVSCDTPANCTYGDVVGEWLFFEGDAVGNSSINCSNFTDSQDNVFKLYLKFPNLVFDDYGNKGYWTIVYNQGFEVVINYRKYFAFSLYEQFTNGTVIDYCGMTKNGWSHDVLGKNWACYHAEKLKQIDGKVNKRKQFGSSVSYFNDLESYVQRINNLQKSWTAKAYPQFRHITYKDLLRKAGGGKSVISNAPPLSPVSSSLKKIMSQFPQEFDWRNVKGVNFVSPVREQGSCGSCYAFSSLGMLESRLRIMTNNTLQVQFSPQDIVSCSEYTQGCEGGFPYVTAGKYAQDFGVVAEECAPYVGVDKQCSTKKCKRYYVADYKYVGGFFGGCNEELMKLDLLQNGPLTVAMEVYDDFMVYQGGIYHHVDTSIGFNPFHLVNHGVLIVGYGVSNTTGEKFWIVKNSWDTDWGENGFFRIRRGTNECSIESMAVSAIPIP